MRDVRSFFTKRTFSRKQRNELPEQLCFWKLEGETATEQRQRFIAEEHRLRGYGDVKHYKKGRGIYKSAGRGIYDTGLVRN